MVDGTKPDDTLVCRCGEITRGEILEAIREGARSVDEVKRMTRAGMGICQGRTCGRLVAQVIQEETGLAMAEIGLSRSRPPVRPIRADVLVQIDAPKAGGGHGAAGRRDA